MLCRSVAFLFEKMPCCYRNAVIAPPTIVFLPSMSIKNKWDACDARSCVFLALSLTDLRLQLGNFHGMAPFGVITDCNSPDFNGVDGILGFGLPKPGMEGRELPRPILWALTDKVPISEAAKSNARSHSLSTVSTRSTPSDAVISGCLSLRMRSADIQDSTTQTRFNVRF